jgi:hypothetical protein
MHNRGMAFILLCVALWAIIAFKVPMDTFGWLMLVATGWFLGFADALLLRNWETKQRQQAEANPTLQQDVTPLFAPDVTR